jgi:diguanylate cyclase (GGDEF)-like protein
LVIYEQGRCAVEKRKFPRQGLGVEAIYVIDNDNACTGVIHDFSQDGLFITFGDDGQFEDIRRQRVLMGAKVEIIVPIDGKQTTFHTTLVHINESGMGVTYTGNKFRAFQQLVQARQQTMSADDETARAIVEGQRVTDESRRLKILNACNAHVKEFMDEMLHEFLNVLEDNLLKEAGKQKNDAAQHPYFDAMAHFKRQHKALPGLVIGKITADAQDIVHGRYKPPATGAVSGNGDQHLSLVEKSDFEEWLIVRVVVSRADLQLREPLIEVQLRLDAAFGKDDGKRLLNPFSPAMITQAFHGAIHGFHLTATVERLVFKVFQDVVLNNLARLYKGLNAIFVKHGVLPDIDVTRYLAAEAMKRNRASQAPSPSGANAVTPANVATASEPAAARPVAGSGASAASAAPATGAMSSAQSAPGSATPGSSFQALKEGLERARHAYSAASRLMKLQRTKDEGSPQSLRHETPATPADPQITQQAIRTLNGVQQQLLDNEITLNEPGSLVRYMVQLSQEDGVTLTEQEVESAEVVENLFSNIVDHQRIVPDLKPELRKLEVPILKVLLQDPRLFSSEYHPARQFVNYVALLADKESVNLNSNRPTILDSIRIVLTSPLEGNEAFVEGLSRLDKVVDREKKIIERNLARVTEACEGQQRIQMANNRVERELAERLQGRSIPRIFNELLVGGWKDLMRLCYLREGVESRAWEMTLVVVDQLMVRLVSGEYDESKLLFKAEELQKLIEKGLSKVPDSKGRNADIIAQLREMLVQGIAADTEMVVYEAVERPGQATPAQSVAPEADDKSMQRWIVRARKLKEGQWLEFDAMSSTSHLYQIAWIAEHQTRFVFVNHHGMKVSDMALEEVAQKLKSGELVVLSDAVLPAVENGLDSLVQKIYDQLALESAHDQLTGMKTRKEFERCLAQSVARAKQYDKQYVLIYLDITQFKVINNTCGYEAGDNLLRDIGTRFRSVLNKDATAGRIGGNEFGVIAMVDSDQHGFQIATELKAAVEEKRFIAGGQSFVIETVTSMLTFDRHNDQVLELLRSVESAVAIAKKLGHREIQVVTQGDSRIEERDEVMAWVARINRALDMNTLKLRCQKIAPVEEGGDVLPHYEVLLTVVDDKGEHLPPADFIRAAEEYSRMAAVDRWVIDTVLRWMTNHKEKLSTIGGFSINLSGHSMNDDSFLDFMFENLVRYGVPRDKLIFEVTETTAVANLEDAADFIKEMRGIGCRFSLDDFGAGQSSYAYLKKLPVDFIKIDGAFVKNIAEDDVDYALVKSITEMGHFLNKKIIAEYVSDKEIMEVVKDIGVDYVQGYYLGKPRFMEDLAMSI